MTFILIPKIMKNSTVEATVAAYKITRDLEGLSLSVALIALTTALVAFILHSTDPKKVADTVISGIRRAMEEANDDND